MPKGFSKSFCKGNNRKTNVHNRTHGKNNHVSRAPLTWNNSQCFSEPSIYNREPFIRLACPHCDVKCLTFWDYKKHLDAKKHLRAMEKRIKGIEEEIENKRKEQAEAQATADRAAKFQGTSSAVMNYCAVCGLEFYQEESKHIASKLHIVLQKLVEPKCNICLYQAKDAVDYENHICSLDHLKREEGWTGERGGYKSQSSEDAVKLRESRSDEASISSKYGTEELSTSNKATTESGPVDSGEHKKDPIHPNSEQTDIFIKEALYCSTCNLFFNFDEGQEAAKVNHCKTPQHLELWIKHEEAKNKHKMLYKSKI